MLFPTMHDVRVQSPQVPSLRQTMPNIRSIPIEIDCQPSISPRKDQLVELPTPKEDLSRIVTIYWWWWWLKPMMRMRILHLLQKIVLIQSEQHLEQLPWQELKEQQKYHYLILQRKLQQKKGLNQVSSPWPNPVWLETSPWYPPLSTHVQNAIAHCWHWKQPHWLAESPLEKGMGQLPPLNWM